MTEPDAPDTTVRTMTAHDLVEWRRRLGLDKSAAAKALGCGRRSLQQWEDPARAQPIPKYIGLACAALALGIREYPSRGRGK